MEAFLYEIQKNKQVKCHLCSHRCVIKENHRGKCGVRENQAGQLNTLVYGRLIARHIDPIEKKPLFHLLPGSLSYSIATMGCNFKCRFCQNADIAQIPTDRRGMIKGELVTPEQVVTAAIKGNCKTIAYTYTEPTVYFEFAFETAKRAHENGIKNVFVTNGYMTAEALEMINPYLDAANVDLKAFTDKYYKIYCSAKIAPVKETLKRMISFGILVEVTTLLIPGLNDNPTELNALAIFIRDSLGSETPWHISRFHPTHQLTHRPTTPVETLSMGREIGIKTGLRYVYTGNVPGESGENTFCYNCGRLLIDRWGFSIRENLVEKNRCTYCGATIDGVGMSVSG